MSQARLETFGVGVFHESMQFERRCGWSPTQPRSVEEQVHGPSACARRNVALHEPSNEHAAPTELGEGARGVGNYRHGAPTELFDAVYGENARSLNVEAIHECGSSCSLAQPFQGCGDSNRQSQGSLGPSRTGQHSATLGFEAESLWDSRFEAVNSHSASAKQEAPHD
jgi:hypothetical protein